MHRNLLIISLCFVSLGFDASAQVTISSSPMGFYNLDLAVGTQTIGVSVVNRALAVAEIGTSAAASVTLTTPADIAALLDSTKTYYIELTNGPAGTADSEVGQRFDVDVAATTVVGQVALDMSSARNTASSLPDLTGYRLVLREHITLNQVFDKSKLHYSTSFADADQIQVFDGSGFSIYYLYGVSGQSQWTPLGSFVSQDNRPIAPGEGLIFKRSAQSPGAVTLSVLGEVRTTPFVQPLGAGNNLVAEGYPLSLSFEERKAYGAEFSDGDKMRIFDGSGFVTYRLYSQGTELADNIWVLLGDPSFANQNGNTHFDYRGAVFFDMAGGGDSYRVDSPIPD